MMIHEKLTYSIRVIGYDDKVPLENSKTSISLLEVFINEHFTF